jgi:hypothetical protein
MITIVKIEIKEKKFRFMGISKAFDLTKNRLKGLERDGTMLHHQGAPLAGDPHIEPSRPGQELAGVIRDLADTASRLMHSIVAAFEFIGRRIVAAGDVRIDHAYAGIQVLHPVCEIKDRHGSKKKVANIVQSRL